MQIPTIDIPKKPTYIHIADDVDFFELFKKVESAYEHCFLFESLGEQGRFSRYSVMGFDPAHSIRAKEQNLYVDNMCYKVENPYKELRRMTPQNVISRGYAGGLVGYMSYEALNYVEPSLSVQIHDRFDQFMFGVYLDGLVYDTMTNQMFYFYYKKNRIDAIRELMSKPAVIDQKVEVTYLGDTLSKSEHAEAVYTTKQYIRDGYSFQCEVGFKSEYEIKGDTMLIYEKLREVNPSPHMYFLKFGKKQCVGASPELLMSVRGREVETHPLAGTVRRGKTVEQDVQLARQLLNDKKEVAEHNMLVDLHRNDIGRVSTFGSVQVRALMNIKKFSFVQHIESEISGLLAKGEDMFTALASLLPGGVLSGAPKIETIKIIDAQEQDARGPYGGALGTFGFNGDATFAIPIRTLFVDGEYAYTQTCSGIVYDSDEEKEYEEIQRKLEGMKKTLELVST